MTNNAISLRLPKLTELTENEDITSYSKWQSNLRFHLSIRNEFAPYLETQWSTAATANRGLIDDGDPIEVANRKTAVQKNIMLERMLEFVAQYAPSLLYRDIIKKSTSIAWVWTRIRRHYGFVQSEVNFLNLHQIKRKDDERYETYFQRILSHLDDNLLTVASGLQHDGAAVAVDEYMSPTTERLAVYLWLSQIDERLPSHIQRVYAHELSMKSLKDLQPHLSRCMDALLRDISTQHDVQVHYTRSSYAGNSRRQTSSRSPAERSQRSTSSSSSSTSSGRCSVCKAAGRAAGHDISKCWHLSRFEKLEMAKTLRITTLELDSEDDDCDNCVETEDCVDSVQVSDIRSINGDTFNKLPCNIKAIIKRVECDISPYFYAFFNHHIVHIVVDSGATSSVVSKSFLLSIGISPDSSHHSAHGAAGSVLKVDGEIVITGLTFRGMDLPLTALVMDKLDCDILAGTPFCKANDVHIHLKTERITIKGITIPYGAGKEKQGRRSMISSKVRRIDSCVIRNDISKVILPGDFVEVSSKEIGEFDGEVSIEPRSDFPYNGTWPSPVITRVIDGTVRIPNLGNEPIKLAKSQHIAQMRRVTCPETTLISDSRSIDTSHAIILPSTTEFSTAISVDPDHILSEDERRAFVDVNSQFDNVFSPNFGVYNDKSGVIRAKLNIGPVEPPPRKGRLPLYGQKDFQLLQEMADHLEELGVLGKPEDHGVTVKHVSPSFIVRDPKNAKPRLVTAFNSI